MRAARSITLNANFVQAARSFILEANFLQAAESWALEDNFVQASRKFTLVVNFEQAARSLLQKTTLHKPLGAYSGRQLWTGRSDLTLYANFLQAAGSWALDVT